MTPSIGDVAAGDRGQADEAAHLDVVGTDLPLPAAERLDAFDAQDVRFDAFDARTERAEKAAEVLHVRLAGCVADDGLARRQRRDHDGVLRRHDAGLVEEDGLAAQRAAAHLVAAADVDLRTELCERVDVRIEPTAADHVTAGRRRADRAEPREQRAGEQERRPHPAAELLVELLLRDVRRRGC